MMDTSNEKYFQRIPLWKNVSVDEWNSRAWQMQNMVRDVETLAKVITLTEKEKKEIESCAKHSKFMVTPYYLSLINDKDPSCPVRLQAIPQLHELEAGLGDITDPLSEDADSPVPHLVHRYPDRTLFLVAETCSMYCRFCTRRRHVLDHSAKQLSDQHDAAIEYIGAHKEVRDVILSGGDALMLPVDTLEGIIKRLRKFPHVEIIRVASRMPCVFPMGVTEEYTKMLAKYQPIYFMTHFNHPYEVTTLAKAACARIADAGIPIQNQSVLLRKVNSDPRIVKKLCHELLKIRVKPYYIYQCDLAEGIEHFRTPVSMGFEIVENMRGHTSGLALPTFVIDAPGGGGKIPVMPNYVLTVTEHGAVVRNYKGLMSSYVNPRDRDCTCSTTADISRTLVEESEANRAFIDLVECRRIKLTPGV